MDLPESISECSYFTKRNLESGYIFAWVLKGEKTLHIKYKCPKCGYEGEIEKEFKSPIKFKCEKCGYEFVIENNEKFKYFRGEIN